MAMMNTHKQKDLLLKATDKGLFFFLKRFPDLWIQYRFGQPINFDSEFHREKGSLSFYFNDQKDRWYFKDHEGQGHFGDMFAYVCFLHNLNHQRDFRRVLNIIKEEMRGFEPPTFNTYSIVKERSKEYIRFSGNEVKGSETLRNYFACSEVISFKLKVVESFAYENDKKIIEHSRSKKNFFIGLEVSENSCYYILQPREDKVWLWGEKPSNYFFGLKESLELNFLKYPNNKENLVLCDNIFDVLSFLYVGIPSILVEPKTVWDNVYFNQIVRATFSNIIVAYSKSLVPRALLANLKVFEKDKIVSSLDNLKSFCQYTSLDDDFMEEMYRLFEYKNEDDLIIENPSARTKVSFS